VDIQSFCRELFLSVQAGVFAADPDDHFQPDGGELLGDCKADASVAAGYQGDPSF
jgi:hypothetical protein